MLGWDKVCERDPADSRRQTVFESLLSCIEPQNPDVAVIEYIDQTVQRRSVCIEHAGDL